MKYVKKPDGTLISSECDTVKVTENNLKKLLDITQSMDYFFHNDLNNSGEYKEKLTQALAVFQYNDTENVTSFNYLFDGPSSSEKETWSFKIPFVIGGKTKFVRTSHLFNGVKLDGIDFDITLKETNYWSNFNWYSMFYECILISFKKPIRIIYELGGPDGYDNRCAIFANIDSSQPDIDWENMFIFESIKHLNGLFAMIHVKNFKMPPANLLDTSKVKCAAGAFLQNWTNIIPAYDFSSVTDAEMMCRYASYIKEFLPTGLKVSFDLSASTQFERANLVTVLNNLGTPTTTQTLTIGSTNLAKLTEEDIAIATQKNWTLK